MSVEGKLDKVFHEGLDIAESQRDGANLSPVPINKLTSAERGMLVAEIVYNDALTSDGNNDCVIEFIDSQFDRGFKSRLSEFLNKHLIIKDEYKLYLSLRNVVGNEFGWLERNLLDNRGVLNELFRFDKFSNETEKLIHTFAEHMPANAIHIYSANFPQSVGSHLRRNILGDALGQGIVDLEGAISFCARCAGEGDDTGRYARTSSLFKGLVMAVKRGMIEPGMLLNFYDSLIENDKNSGKKELTLSILDTIDDLASIIPSGRIESSDVIGLYDKIFYPRPRTDISFFRVALEALARTIPSGRTEPEEILRRFNDYFSTMGSWDEVDWDCTLRTLKGLYESVPSEMKGDIKRLYSLYFEQHPRKGPDPNHRMFVDTARQADIGSLGDLDLKSFAALIPEKHIDPKKVVSLYEACLGVCIIEDIDKLASAILSGNVDADDVIKVYRKCAKTEPWRALRSLPSLVDCIPSGRVTAHSCAGLFEEALKKDKFDFGDDRIDETISAYISLVGYGVIRPEEVMKRYEDCLDDDKNRVDCAKKLWLMLPLVEFGKLAPESVFGLYKKFVDGRTDHFFEFGKESLNALIRLTDHPGLALNEVIDFFRLLVDKGWSLENIVGSLDLLSDRSPKEALKIYTEIQESFNRLPLVITPLDIAPKEMKFKYVWAEVRRSIKDHAGQPNREFLDLSITLAANYYRFCKVSDIYSRLNKPHQLSNEQMISDYVGMQYNHLRGFQRDQITEILIDLHEYAKRHPETFILGGHSSYRMVDLTDDLVKFAVSMQNKGEDRVYSMKDSLGIFGRFIADKRGSTLELDNGLSMLIIENLRKRGPGYEIAESIFKSLTDIQVPWNTSHQGHNLAMLNLFILGFAHKELTKAADEGGIEFPEAEHMTSGLPHYKAIRTPIEETSERVYRELMRTVPEPLVRESGRIIERIMKYARDQDNKPIILGDNKLLENMCNGYVFDFANSGRGFEIDDITYALVEPRLGIPLQGIKQYIDGYITMRSLHDPEFRKDAPRICQEMLSLADPSILKSLSRYAANTRKRTDQMESGEIIPRRQYFINAMKFILEKGDFSDFR